MNPFVIGVACVLSLKDQDDSDFFSENGDAVKLEPNIEVDVGFGDESTLLVSEKADDDVNEGAFVDPNSKAMGLTTAGAAFGAVGVADTTGSVCLNDDDEDSEFFSITEEEPKVNPFCSVLAMLENENGDDDGSDGLTDPNPGANNKVAAGGGAATPGFGLMASHAAQTFLSGELVIIQMGQFHDPGAGAESLNCETIGAVTGGGLVEAASSRDATTGDGASTGFLMFETEVPKRGS